MPLVPAMSEEAIRRGISRGGSFAAVVGPTGFGGADGMDLEVQPWSAHPSTVGTPVTTARSARNLPINSPPARRSGRKATSSLRNKRSSGSNRTDGEPLPRVVSTKNLGMARSAAMARTSAAPRTAVPATPPKPKAAAVTPAVQSRRVPPPGTVLDGGGGGPETWGSLPNPAGIHGSAVPGLPPSPLHGVSGLQGRSDRFAEAAPGAAEGGGESGDSLRNHTYQMRRRNFAPNEPLPAFVSGTPVHKKQ